MSFLSSDVTLRVRSFPRLLPLPLLLAAALSAPAARAATPPLPDWSQCPIEDAVPAFPEAQEANGSASRDNAPTDVDGDVVHGIDGQSLTVSGHVILRRGDQFLGTDNLEYAQDTGTYIAIGNVRYQDAGLRILADRLQGNQSTNAHTIDNVRYQLIERRGNGASARAEMSGHLGHLYHSTYSTCPPSERRWELRARQIDVNTHTGMGVARGAKFHIGQVPVLYVPWLAFPIDERRVSGLLYPRISRSSRNGLDWMQPVYLNLAPNYDMTLSPRWMSNRGLQLGTQFRWLHPRGNGIADLEVLPSDDLTRRERQREIDDNIRPENRRKDDRIRFNFTSRQRLTGTWQARSHLAWISDPRYVEDFSDNIDGNLGTYLRSSVGLYGRGMWWDAGLSADYYLLTDYLRADTSLPYHRLPRLTLNWNRPYGRITAALSTNLTRFQHTTGSVRSSTRVSGGTRLDLKPALSLPLEGASWFVTPTVSWRYTRYDLDAPLVAGGNTTPERSLPITSLDAGLFFERRFTFRERSYLNTLEPRLFWLHAPYRDQSAIPLFDTRPLSFSWGQLFRDNRYSGGDRQADANQVTLGLTTRFINAETGREKFSASLGQIHYLRDSRITVGSEIPVSEGRSAWVAESTYAINDRWNLTGTYQWNPSSREDDLISLRTRYLIADRGIANLAYRYRRHPITGQDLLEQIDFSFLYPINPTWSVVGRYYYSLLDDKVLEAIAGVQWESCCMAVRLVNRRYVRNYRGDINNTLQLEIEFKGLGSAGQNMRERLRSSILGYYRDDLYLVPPSERGGGADDTDDSLGNLIP